MIAAVTGLRTWLTLLLAVGICAAAAADTPPPPLDTPLLADLDGDGTAETVRARETACFGPAEPTQPPCPRDSLRSLVVEVADGCAGGASGVAEHVLTLSREMDFVSFAQIVDADGDGAARELAFELRAGATARGVQAKVVSFRAGAGGCVAVRRTLFSYPRADSIGRRPRGAYFASGSLEVKDYARAIAGLELRTIETYSRPRDAGCCPSYRRVSYWRLNGARDGYRTYSTKLRRLRKPF